MEVRLRSRMSLLLAGGLLLCGFCAIGLRTAVGSHAASPVVYVFPIPGANVAGPKTQITFRGVPASQIGSITVTGSVSGAHAGRVLADSDGMGGSFLPSAPFTAGELVTVSTGLSIAGATAGSFSFTIATPAGNIRGGGLPTAPAVKGEVTTYVSRPDLQTASTKVIKRPSSAAPGDIFVAPQRGPAQEGPMILGPYGGLIWFKPMPKNITATDFRVQTYQGKPALTWWQGSISGLGVGEGYGAIYNSSYHQVATVKAGNGPGADLHEFQITSQDTALITAYYPVIWNSSSVKGGSKRSVVLDAIVQEIDLPTGLVLYQWDSLDHVPVSDSHQPYPTTPNTPYDYFHVNSVQEATDGSLIVSARNTWAAYDLSHQTGAINWTLNGKHSSFTMGPNTSFAFQHDARLQANDQITIFDDGAGPPVVHKQSRALTLQLDMTNMTATLASQDQHRPGLLAEFEGSVQPLPNGDEFVGWGQQPNYTEFNARGQTVFDGRFVSNLTYRAYRFPWSGAPTTLPAVAAKVSGTKTTVYASWNGATNRTGWRILAGTRAGSLKAVAKFSSRAFESVIGIGSGEQYVAAQALDSHGQVLAISHTVKIP